MSFSKSIPLTIASPSTRRWRSRSVTPPTLDYARKNEKRKAVLTKDGWASTDVYQQTTSTVGQSEGAVALDNAAVAKAQLDLKRTVIRSPANGYVTNLLVRLGDYATVGQKVVSVVDTDSFWVDGYFEETALGRIHEGDRANIELMGYSQVVRGHVDSVARGINVPNAQPDQTGLASVNPIFTWVRLAQRVPVRIHIDHVPEGVRLVSGRRRPWRFIRNRTNWNGELLIDPNRHATSGWTRAARETRRTRLLEAVNEGFSQCTGRTVGCLAWCLRQQRRRRSSPLAAMIRSRLPTFSIARQSGGKC